MTYWYEIYYEVFLGGKYFRRMDEMHKEYGTCDAVESWPLPHLTERGLKGPVVRINPNEVHFNDPDFIDTLYPAGGRKTNKPIMVGQRTGSWY